MPYERWISADTWWLLALAVFPISTKSEGDFQVGAIAAIIGYAWWRHRETRKQDWFAEQERQFRIQSIADLEADKASP